MPRGKRLIDILPEIDRALGYRGVRVGGRTVLCDWDDSKATHTWTAQGSRFFSCPRHKSFAQDHGATARRIGG